MTLFMDVPEGHTGSLTLSICCSGDLWATCVDYHTVMCIILSEWIYMYKCALEPIEQHVVES